MKEIVISHRKTYTNAYPFKRPIVSHLFSVRLNALKKRSIRLLNRLKIFTERLNGQLFPFSLKLFIRSVNVFIRLKVLHVIRVAEFTLNAPRN